MDKQNYMYFSLYFNSFLLNDLRSSAMFNNSKLSAFFIRNINLPFILSNLINILVLLLQSFFQRNAWLRSFTEIYYIYRYTDKTLFFKILTQLVYIFHCILCQMHEYHQISYFILYIKFKRQITFLFKKKRISGLKSEILNSAYMQFFGSLVYVPAFGVFNKANIFDRLGYR